MSLLNTISVDEIRSRGTLTEADVLSIRRAYYEDGVIDAREADTLCRLNAACPTQHPTWTDCFVEMLTDYMVNQQPPEGYVTAENAQWLMTRIAPNGTVDTKAELELLVNVIDKARWSPQSLVAFALAQVKRAIVDGQGPLRAGRSLPTATVDDAEVELLKRILYAFGGDGNIGVTRAEADVLFDIDVATHHNANAAGWQDLYVKAIANCVMCASGYAPPSREQALAQEGWLQRRGDLSPGSFVAAAVRGAGMLAAYREQSSEERAIAVLERQKIEIVTAEEVTVPEAQWLIERIASAGELTPNAAALIAFLHANSPRIAPELDAMVDRLRHAA